MGVTVLLLHIGLYAQQKPSVIHRAGVSIRPAWNQQMWQYFKGANPSGEPLTMNASLHLQYSFMFPEGSRLGDMYPTAYQGLGIAPYTFFSRESVGYPVAVYVFQGGRLARLGNRLSLDYEWNFGASFGWRSGSVSSTCVNAFIDAGLMMTWCPVPEWSVSAGADLFHFSNGSVRLPNTGLNCLGMRLGVVRIFGSEHIQDQGRPVRRADDGKYGFIDRMAVDVNVYGTAKQIYISRDNSKYDLDGTFAVVGMHLNPMYQACRLVRAGVSLDLEYDASANRRSYVYQISDGVAYSEDPQPGTQFSAGFSLRTEFLMPIFSVNLGVGYNVMARNDDQRGGYFLIALKTWFTDNLYLHTGYKCRGLYRPEHLMLGLGWSFGR